MRAATTVCKDYFCHRSVAVGWIRAAVSALHRKWRKVFALHWSLLQLQGVRELIVLLSYQTDTICQSATKTGSS
jgi:hypothetical protein